MFTKLKILERNYEKDDNNSDVIEKFSKNSTQSHDKINKLLQFDS